MSGGQPDLRRLLLPTLMLAMAGTAAELALLEHWEDWKQWLPFAVLALSSSGLILAVVTRSALALRMTRAGMVALAATGVAGIYLHFMSNLEFEREMYAGRDGVELTVESLKGAMPTLAPGALVFIALVGLVFTFRHPLLSPRKPRRSPTGGP